MSDSRHARIPVNLALKEKMSLSTWIEHRGHTLEIILLPDEVATPNDGIDSSFEVSPDQAEAWRRGEWWYYQQTIKVFDCVLHQNVDWKGAFMPRIPSFIDQQALLEKTANELCDYLETPSVESVLALNGRRYRSLTMGEIRILNPYIIQGEVKGVEVSFSGRADLTPYAKGVAPEVTEQYLSSLDPIVTVNRLPETDTHADAFFTDAAYRAVTYSDFKAASGNEQCPS